MQRPSFRARKTEMKNLPAQGPAFCKIIMANFISKLRMPPAFAEKYGRFLSEKVTLETDQPGNSWDVTIEKMDGDYWLTHGWQKFMKENKLIFPDFLVFRFVKDSKILVTIFDKNGCKRDAPTHINLEQENPSKRNKRYGTINISSSAESKNTKLSFTWKNSMKKGMMIKRSICEEIGFREERTVEMKNLEGHIFRVRIFKSKDGRVGTGEGWSAFVNASNLVSDETYEFEFIQSCNNKLLLQLNLIEK